MKTMTVHEFQNINFCNNEYIQKKQFFHLEILNKRVERMKS